MAGVSCGAKDLSDILLKDKSGKIAESGKQVLLVEANTNITPTFLKYQNVNFLMALSQVQFFLTIESFISKKG